jgi:DNA helicase HerA-like ATPase
MIPRSSLDDLDLEIPDFGTQEKIVTIDALAERERALAMLVAETRRKMLSMILVERANRLRPATRQERTSK